MFPYRSIQNSALALALCMGLVFHGAASAQEATRQEQRPLSDAEVTAKYQNCPGGWYSGPRPGKARFARDPWKWVVTPEFAKRFCMPEEFVSTELKGAEAVAFRLMRKGDEENCGFGGNPNACWGETVLRFEVYIRSDVKLPKLHEGRYYQVARLPSRQVIGRSMAEWQAMDERGLMRRVPAGLHWASFHDLTARSDGSRHAVHPRTVLRFAPAQYATWGPDAPLKPFDESAVHPWIPMESLTGDAPCWMLADLLISRAAVVRHSMLVSAETSAGGRYAFANSSGCAASPSRRYALENAVLELVERDAFMRLWLQRAGACEFSSQLLETATQATVNRLREMGGEVIFLRLLSVFAEVVLCVAQFRAQSFTLCGAGAHWDLCVAAHKALSEVATGSIARLAGVQTAPLAPEDVRSPVDHLHLYCQPEYFRKADFLFGFRRNSAPPLKEGMPRNCTELLSALKAVGMKAYACWLDAPQMPYDYKGRVIHAVRVVVPGLVPMTFGHRLMPWVPELNPVSDYNDFPHPFP
jgi:thiazole/oxazole-forming peptide maturase SagD family component